MACLNVISVRIITGSCNIQSQHFNDETQLISRHNQGLKPAPGVEDKTNCVRAERLVGYYIFTSCAKPNFDTKI